LERIFSTKYGTIESLEQLYARESRMYDVIVAGAGPAGSAAAAALSKVGRRVLLIDRSTFPRDKTCGDAIQAGALALLYDLGYQGTIDQSIFTHIADWTIEAPSRVSVSANLHAYKGEHAPYIARRLNFDNLVYRQAIANGANFCQAQVTSPIFDGDKVVGVVAKPVGSKDSMEFRAPIVIAADGATSVIARDVRKERDADVHWAIAIRCYVTMREDLKNRCEFYFPKSILPGYAWIFPSGEHGANIGVGIRLDKYRQQNIALSDLLERFLDDLGGRVDRASVAEIKSWQIPFGSRRNSRAFGGCMLVGDAGNFVDPLLGAGIYFGMKTGMLAAQVADSALRDSDTSQRRLSEFDRLWKRVIGWPLRRATLVQKIIIGQPWLLNSVIGIASLNKELGRRLVMALSGEKI
jgi:geranylgeranyl reductase family protein